MFVSGEALCLGLVPTDIAMDRHGGTAFTVTMTQLKCNEEVHFLVFTQETGVARTEDISIYHNTSKW